MRAIDTCPRILNDPARNLCLDASLQEVLHSEGQLAFFLLIFKDFELYRELYGQDVLEQLDLAFDQAVQSFSGCRHGDISPCHFFRLGQGEKILAWTDQKNMETKMEDTAFTLQLEVRSAISKQAISMTGRDVRIRVGYAILSASDSDNREQRLHEAILDARLMAREELATAGADLVRDIGTIIRDELVSVVYQPIYDMKTGAIISWEALSRGPEESPLHSPVLLFDLAERMGRLFALERVCRKKALLSFGPCLPGQKLFLNIHPRTLVDPQFTPGETLRLLRDLGMTPESVVFEITERHSIRDFTVFHRTLDHYRGQGFQIAVDDAGTGYSGLSTIATLRPEYIKVDMSLVRNVDRDPVKRALMETLVAFADKIGSKIIAEGIEGRGEAARLMDIGVHYGQGYFFGRPVFPKSTATIPVRDILPVRAEQISRLSCSIPVGQIASPAVSVPESTLVGEVQKIFDRNPALNAVVVTRNQKPVGLVMSYALDRTLASQYGRALYTKKPITSVMDAKAMVVDGQEAVESVARQANDRERIRTYDEVVVTTEGRLLGLVSVQRMLSTLARVQVEMAKGTSPLSGLPGNIALEQELDLRLRSRMPFTLIYADLDNFKVYNDVYGFKNGDKIILLLAHILTWAIKRHGDPHSTLFHIGGDDFVSITSQEKAERVSLAVVRCFARLAPSFYREEDRTQGWILGHGRDGLETRVPLVSVSLGLLDCLGTCTLQQLGERAAQVKAWAKSQPGNVFVRDRRRPVGDEDKLS